MHQVQFDFQIALLCHDNTTRPILGNNWGIYYRQSYCSPSLSTYCDLCGRIKDSTRALYSIQSTAIMCMPYAVQYCHY